MKKFNEMISFIWDSADLLRNAGYTKNQYQDVILPLVVLKRFDTILEATKDKVVSIYKENEKKTEENKVKNLDPILKRVSGFSFYNCSEYTLSTLLDDPENLEENLNFYMKSFSPNIQDIFDKFKFYYQIESLGQSNSLYNILNKFNDKKINLHPDNVSNHQMGYIFEHLVRKFAETSNEEAGDHFTPREVIALMTNLMYDLNNEELKKDHIIKTVYDPACGTGGMLTISKDHILRFNSSAEIELFGQELQPKIYAVCKSDMLIKGENADNIKFGSTLSNDKLNDMKFDFILSNPPYGVKWENDKDAVLEEAESSKSRFSAGTPRINDGQLLFIQHMISKMKDKNVGKSRIAAITNGSPLFTGDAGSGESNIRKWILENDYLEALIALPNQLFYNTGITTYIWILTNKKSPQREGKVQLIDARSEKFYKKMRKSLGNKRNELAEHHIEDIFNLYRNFEETEFCKIFDNEDFLYTKITVERPQQYNFKVTHDRVEKVIALNSFQNLAKSQKKKDKQEILKEEAKGKQLQEDIVEKLKKIDDDKYLNYDDFYAVVSKTLKDLDLKPALIKNIVIALGEPDEEAELIKDKKGNLVSDSSLRDNEIVPLKDNVDEYFAREVKKYYPHAWVDFSKNVVGCEINFTKYFYKYEPPRPLKEIQLDIKNVLVEIEELTKEEL